ncbi:hypothetical protein AVEN_126026-1 [Araneus ventricosus]|uniref:Uncharacterized protein n=1 Tax=Araneus ventricosus TaxID=182803 RepID=A0A4Y2NH69_ARAVE|nr:hypothetical protein AVEN_126026-1 [Araneus ventricosus]
MNPFLRGTDLVRLTDGTRCLNCPVAVFRTGARGARLVPGYPKGPQNLFDRLHSAKLTTDLRHWILGGTYNNFAPATPFYQNPPLQLP